jgi:hypothetical protein
MAFSADRDRDVIFHRCHILRVCVFLSVPASIGAIIAKTTLSPILHHGAFWIEGIFTYSVAEPEQSRRLDSLRGVDHQSSWRHNDTCPYEVDCLLHSPGSKWHTNSACMKPNWLLLFSDENANTGPTIMPQSRPGSPAQGHNAHILCGEWVARL